jgi:hypothetical protein
VCSLPALPPSRRSHRRSRTPVAVKFASQYLLPRLRMRVWTPLSLRVGGALRRLRNAGRRYRPVFVCGAMGSGTSLLCWLLAQRNECAAVLPESALQIRRSSFLAAPRLRDVTSVRGYERALLPDPRWRAEEGRAELLRLYRTLARGVSETVIDKSPNTHQLRAGFLAACFPEAPFVLIFRDPVANIEGFRRKWKIFGEDELDESIRFYRTLHETFFEQLAAAGERVFVVEYEKLVEATDLCLQRIVAFCGLAPARSEATIEDRENRPGLGVRNVRDGKIGLLRDASREAVARLSQAEVEHIRAELGPLHERLHRAAEASLAGSSPGLLRRPGAPFAPQ